MISTTEILKRASQESGFNRVRYVENDIPEDVSKVTVFMFYGDVRSMAALSSLVLKRYREEVKGSRYFILCSWPGYAGLFPFVNEYWEISSEEVNQRLFREPRGTKNVSSLLVPFRRSLNWYFTEVLNEDALSLYYIDYIQEGFWERFKHVKRFKPTIPSSTILGEAFNRELEKRKGFKVFLQPSLYVENWEKGRCDRSRTTLDFWYYLARELVLFDMVPVVWQNDTTHDISGELTDQAIYVTDRDVMKVMAGMRATGCVLDVFNGISRLAMISRTPFIACDIRNRYNILKEWEVNGLMSEKQLSKDYIFSFSTIINFGLPVWKSSLFDIVTKRLQVFRGSLDRGNWPPTSESLEIIPYKEVQQQKIKKLGTHFIKVPKDERD